MDQLGGAELIAKALRREGVGHLFTLCGAALRPICGAAAAEGIRVIEVRHEQAAAMAADALARCTREPACALVGSGASVANAVTGIVNAQQADSPVVLIGGSSPVFHLEVGLQEMDQLDMMRPITRWCRRVHETRRLPEYVDLAFRHARARRGPVYLEVPMDILFGNADVSPPAEKSDLAFGARVYADARHVEAAAAILRDAHRPVVLAGSTIWWARAETPLAALAEALRAPVFATGMARGALRPEHPLLFQHARRSTLAKADAVLLIGSPLDFRLGYGRYVGPSARLIEIDSDPATLGHWKPIDVGIVGDPRAALEQLAAALGANGGGERASRRAWLESVRARETDGVEQSRAREASDAVPTARARLAREIGAAIDDETVIIGDGDEDWLDRAARTIGVRRPGHWIDAGPLGCQGVGPSFAIAAKLAWPRKKVVLLTEVGAFGLNGFELETAISQQIPITTVIASEGTVRYDRVAAALGCHAEHVERPGDLRPALERALAAGRASCVSVVVGREAGERAAGGGGGKL